MLQFMIKIIKPYIVVESSIDGIASLKSIEKIARVCYKSEDKITDDSYKAFIKKILDSGHHSVLEHIQISVRVTCDRGISHELVRHRIASYTQESTRYCNYKNIITFILPKWFYYFVDEHVVSHDYDFYDYLNTVVQNIKILSEKKTKNALCLIFWFDCMHYIDYCYNSLILNEQSPQQARSVLPHSLATQIIMTMNLREWKHFFELRTNKCAHPQMVEIASMILFEFKRLIPIIFDDIKVENIL